MYFYGIESVEKKKNKKVYILIIIVAVILMITAILGGIKMAEYMSTKKQLGMQDENLTEKQNNPQGNDDTLKNTKGLSEEQMQSIHTIYNSDEKRAFLTFDDGPSYSVTPKILDILKENNIKATFFVLGTMVKSNPEILKREYEEGHYIANHGYSHIYKKIYQNEKTVLEEYEKTNQLIQDALENPNYQSNVFRFPGGSVGGYYDEIKKKAKQILAQNNIAYLDWNALTYDADGASTKEEIMKNLKNTCGNQNSVVILMHDAPNKDLTAKTLQEVINYLKKQDYTFYSLYDIL